MSHLEQILDVSWRHLRAVTYLGSFSIAFVMRGWRDGNLASSTLTVLSLTLSLMIILR